MRKCARLIYFSSAEFFNSRSNLNELTLSCPYNRYAFMLGKALRLRHTLRNPKSSYLGAMISIAYIQGVFFTWPPPKKLKYGKPGLGEVTYF